SEANLPTAPSSPPASSRVANVASVVSSRPPERTTPEASAPLRPMPVTRFSSVDLEQGNIPVLVKRFGISAAMILLGIVITVIDGAYAGEHGEVFTLGPIRLA